jgi:hypothetical protein
MSDIQRHRFHVWVDVPVKSGDGWSQYPDYSAEEIGRALRRALHHHLEFDAVVEHADSAIVDEDEKASAK